MEGVGIMLNMVFAETALELVPRELWREARVSREAKRRRKARGEMLLDASKHFAAMASLAHKEKRGRPDIAHDLLKLALDSSLNKAGRLRVFMHTYDDKVISVSPETRIPRSYNSFCGLMEDLFKKRVIESGGKRLLSVEEKNLSELLKELELLEGGCEFIVFDAGGKQESLRELIELFEGKRGKEFSVIIGGFPHGGFLDERALASLPKLALGKLELTAPTVLAKVLACYEIALEQNLRQKD